MATITAVPSTLRFKEVASNNGAIANSLTIQLTNGTFAGDNGDLVNATIDHVPAGLTAVLVKTSATTAKLSFTGAATAHASAQNVTNLMVTFAGSNFAIGDGVPAPITGLAIDFSNPAAAKTLTLVAPLGASTSETYKVATLPTITGTAPDGVSTVHIYNDGGTKPIGTATVADNAWSFTLPGTKIKDGMYNLTASASGDGSGAMTAGFAFTVDTKAPAAPSVNAIKGAISDTTPVLSGKTEKGASVEVFADGASLGTATADAKGLWTLAVTNNVLAAGDKTYKISATATDAAGNTANSKKDVELLIDTKIATPTLIATIKKNTVTLTGKVEGETGGTLQLYGGADGSVALGKEIKIGKDGTWKSSVKLAEGNHLLSVVATDAAGNVSVSSAVANTTIDTSTATPTLELVKTGDVLTGFKGTAEAGATVKIAVGKQTLETIAGADGNWEVTDLSTITAVTKDTKLKITAIATDTATNVSKASTAVEHTFKPGDEIDSSAPTIVSAKTSADGTKIVLTYNETLLTTPTADKAAFTVKVGATDNLVTGASVVGKTVELALTTAIKFGEAGLVKVGYTAPTPEETPTPANAAIQDAAGNDAVLLTDYAVTKSVSTVLLSLTNSAITGYVVADHTIQLSKAVFTALGAPGSTADFLSVAAIGGLTGGDTDLSTDAAALIYIQNTGKLFYNEDGATEGGLTLIGSFSNKPVLVAGEFEIVA